MPELPPWPTAEPVVVPAERIAGWGGATFNTVCLESEQSFNRGYGPDGPLSISISSISESIDNAVAATLFDLGFQVVGPEEACEASLGIVLEGQALSENYGNMGRCYSGALTKIQMELTAPGYPRYTDQFNDRIDPPSSITACTKEPEHAQFKNLDWREGIFGGLVQIWGKDVYGPGIVHLVHHTYPNELVKESLDGAMPYGSEEHWVISPGSGWKRISQRKPKIIENGNMTNGTAGGLSPNRLKLSESSFRPRRLFVRRTGTYFDYALRYII